jgi:type IX secretion system PorP/SprF family membrane protein
MLTRIFKLSVFSLLLINNLQGQDVQFSQYYNSPLYLNPALTGTGDNTRGILNYRSQWTALPSPYVSSAFSFDHFIAPYSSGVGLIVKRDRQGDAGLVSTDVNLIYSYHIYISEDFTFIPALQVGIVNRSLNYSSLVFGDQLTNSGSTGLPTSDNFPSGARKTFADFSTGGILFSDKFWIGLSEHHLNTPNQALAGDSKLPRKMSIHGGYKLYIEEPVAEGMYHSGRKEKSIIPTFNYKMQGQFDQFDLGVYGIYQHFMAGLWYRGIPVKRYKEGLNNNESLIMLIGVNYMGLSVGYSYDLTISSQRPGSGGAHEISLIYEWEIPYQYKGKKRARKVSCPKFYR